MNKFALSLALSPFILLPIMTGQAFAQKDFADMSLEDLMKIEVYSASKKLEPLVDTAAAVTVITPEDIRRSGATSIPELLRMVPGLRVEKINSHSWDISARGFNGSSFANKLLVLIDGRSVYTPLHGGVLWTLQDTVLEDIERIEVIRGPGGTLWGANAVNGVINIITKKAKDAQGTLVSAGAGTEERGFGTVRYGGQANDWFYRGYAKYFNRDDGFSPIGNDVDQWDMAQGGFRLEKNEWTVQGDYYNGGIDSRVTETLFTAPFSNTVTENADAMGWNLLTRYEQEDWSLQTYWDETQISTRTLSERRDKFDLEYSRRTPLTENQELNWGGGYRLALEKTSNTETIVINKAGQTDQIFNVFVQDEVKLLDDKMKFTLGSKFEHNIYTGLEIQPNVRVLYHLNEQNQVWAAASRAIRTPSRVENNGVLTAPVAGPAFLRVTGNDDLKSEKMRAFELGYRSQLNKTAMIDLALFSDYYDDLIAYDYGLASLITDRGFPVSVVPTRNILYGEVHGAELSAEVMVKEWWKLKGYYSLTKMSLKTQTDAVDVGFGRALNVLTPVHSSYLRSSFNLPRGFELDATFRYTGTFAQGAVPSMAEVDINLTKTVKGWQVALVGSNLIESHHKETNFSTSTQVQRGGYIKVTRRF